MQNSLRINNLNCSKPLADGVLNGLSWESCWRLKNRIFFHTLLLSSLVLLLSSCARIDDTQTLRVNLSCEPATLDWNKASDAFSFDVITSLMVGLTRYKSTRLGLSKNHQAQEAEAISVEPMIAKSWEINAKQDEYIFHLDPEAKWHDGVPITAQHFLDSIKRTLDPMTAAPYADLLSMIDLERSSARDERTLFIKLKQSTPYFIYMTAHGLMFPVRLDLIKKYGDKWTEPNKFVGNGAFKLSKWQHEYKIELERVPNNFVDALFERKLTQSQRIQRRAEILKRIKFFMVAEQSQAFTLYKNHQFDFVDGRSIPSSELQSLKSSVNEALIAKPLLRSTYVGFNNSKGPLKDLHLRRALFYAIDRRALVSALKRNYVASASWIPSGLPEYYNAKLANPDTAYDPEYARAELKLAKQQKPHLLFAFPSTEEAKQISETLQSMWKKELGITVELRSMEWKAYLSSLESNPPDIFRMNWTADYPDPDSFMQIFMTTNPINHPRWSNSKYDNLVAHAASLPLNSIERRQAYIRAEEILLKENCAVAPIFTNTQTLIQSANLRNLKVNAMDMLFLDRITKVHQ